MKKLLQPLLLALVLVLPSYLFAQPTLNPPSRGSQVSQEDIDHFSHAFEAVRMLYVDKVSDKEILENAIQGMLSGLDPHSTYLNEQDLQELKTATDGKFSGIGIEVTMEYGVIKVVTPLDDSPAAKAGIKPGDYIIKVDGKTIRGMKLTKVVDMMRGPENSKVHLTVLRKGETKPLQFDLTRETINLKSVRYEVMDNYYGYIRISRFQSDTGAAVKDAVMELQKQTNGKLRGIVLDLRNNPGGLLTASIEVSDVFLDANKLGYDRNVVYTKGRLPESGFEGKAEGTDQLHGAPIVVLVNSGSASAAEIVAGALQDHHRAVIAGTRTFGKGSVQTLLPLDKQGSVGIKLTTARYYTPSGRSIQAKGIEPDILIQDIKLPKDSGVKEELLIDEASLQGHLEQENADATAQPLDSKKAEQEDKQLMDTLTSTEKKEKDAPLIYRDYQLYEALHLLQGLSIVYRINS